MLGWTRGLDGWWGAAHDVRAQPYQCCLQLELLVFFNIQCHEISKQMTEKRDQSLVHNNHHYLQSRSLFFYGFNE